VLLKILSYTLYRVLHLRASLNTFIIEPRGLYFTIALYKALYSRASLNTIIIGLETYILLQIFASF